MKMNFIFFLICFLLVNSRRSMAEGSESEKSDVKFLTKLVGDVLRHDLDYVRYYATGSLAPQATSLISRLSSYTDDSYTTLIDNSQIQVDSLRSIVTWLPWGSRIQSGGKDVSSSRDSKESNTSSEKGKRSSDSSAGNGTAYVPIGFLLSSLVLLLL